MKRVVITGLGAITPIGNNVETYWQNLIKGQSGAGLITRFDTTLFKTKFACEVKGFDPKDHFDRKEARNDLFNLYGMVAGEEAIQDAQLTNGELNKHRVGIIFGSGIGGFETFEKEITSFVKQDEVPRFSPFFITWIIANNIAGMLSIRHGFRGVNYCPVSACASSTQAIIQAAQYIKWGKADIIITGGAEAPITKPSIGGFNSMRALSTNNENFLKASRPFDQNRDGFVIGEGAGALVIESLESAVKRSAKIYAEIVGGGESSDAYHISGTHPKGLGATLAMQEALNEAEISANQINYLNAHATSTGIGDLSEIKAIQAVFGQMHNLHISATKSITGHLLGGTGAIEAIATALSIKEGIIPPTINTTDVDDQIPSTLNLTLGQAKKKPVEYALSNSFGFGGHCAALVLKKCNQ